MERNAYLLETAKMWLSHFLQLILRNKFHFKLFLVKNMSTLSLLAFYTDIRNIIENDIKYLRLTLRLRNLKVKFV